MSPLPDSPGKLLTDDAALRAVFQRLRALRNLSLDITTPEGITTLCPLRRSAGNAILSGSFSLPGAETLHPETIVWRDAIAAASGTFGADSIALADALIRAINAASFNRKIIYLLPLLGADITAARMPLRDSLGIGLAGNTGFTDSDYSESTGLQGDGSSKLLDTNLRPSQLGASNNGGLGWWENNLSLAGSGTQPIGCFDAGTSDRFGIPLANQRFQWGAFANSASIGAVPPATNGHFYGQRSSSASRVLYKDGASIATNTTVDAATGAAAQTIRLLGADEGGTLFYWPGRCAVAYLTDGTLSAGEVAAFHSLLSTYLITPTGR